MARNVATYISNLGKSVVYSTVDKVKKEMPATAEYKETNQELFKDIYNNVYNFRAGMNRSYNLFKNSKVYEAADAYKKNLLSDISTGQFYNKKSDSNAESKALGMDESLGGFDDINFDTDSDFDMGSWDAEDDDLQTPIARSTSAMSMAVAKTGEYIVENQRATSNLFYGQAVKSTRQINSNLDSINHNIGNVINFSNDVIKIHVDNSKIFYEKSTEYLSKQVELLQDIHKKLIIEPQEQAQKKTNEKKKLTYNDLVGVNGAVDLKQYFGQVKKNVNNQLSMFDMFSGMGEGNPLMAFVSSPLKFIPNAIANKIVPEMMVKSMKQLDQSISGLFGSAMAKFNTMKKDDNPIMAAIGEALGINNRTKGSIDTSKYNKDKIDWNGKANKALIDVIPGQLAEIISLMSGKEKKVFDYDSGKYTEVSKIAEEFQKTNTRFVDAASSDMKKEFEEMMKVVTFNSLEERKNLNTDIEKFFERMFHSGKMFIPGNKDNDTEFSDISGKNMKLIEKMFSSSNRATQLKLNGQMLEARDKQYSAISDLENNGNSIFNHLFNNSGVSSSSDSKKIAKELEAKIPNIKNITDNKGNNTFYYLQNIYKELVDIRTNGSMGSGSNKNMQRQVIDSQGRTYSPEAPSAFKIPDNRKPNATGRLDLLNKEKENTRYLEKEKQRLKKVQYSINASDTDDNKIANAFDSALDVQRIRTKLDNDVSKQKRSLIDKLLEANTVSDKMGVVLNKLNDISKKPVEFFSRTLDKVDQRLYEVIYGRQDSNGKDIGFMEALTTQVKDTFKKVNGWIDENILNPLKDKIGVDDFREAPKKLLGMMGIDTDKIKANVKDFFTGKDGILAPMRDGIKDAFKGAFTTVKESVGNVTAPIRNKMKSRKTKSKINNEFLSLDEGNPTETSSVVKSVSKRNILNGIDHDIYDNLSNEDKQAYLERYLNYRDNLAVPIADKRAEELRRKSKLQQTYSNKKNGYYNSMSNLEDAVQQGTMGNKAYQQLSDKIDKRQNDMQFAKGKINSSSEYLKNLAIDEKDIAEHRKRLDVLNKSGFIKGYKEYYGKGLGKLIDGLDGTDVEALQKSLGRFAYSNYNNDEALTSLTLPQLIQSASAYGKTSKNSSFDTIANKLNEFSSVAEIDPNMSVDDIIKRGISKVNKDTKETDISNYENLISGKEEGSSAISTTLLTKISNSVQNIEKYIFTLLSRKIRKDTNVKDDNGDFNDFVENLPLPTGSHPALKTPEGGAMKDVASKIGDLVANWFGGNIKQFWTGGGIDKTQMVTVSEGEAVLNQETVDTLTGLMNKLTNSIVSKKDRLSNVAKDNFGPLLDVSKKLGISNKDELMNLMNKYKDKDTVRNMDEDTKGNYDKVINTLGSTVSQASGLKEKISTSLEKDINPFIRQTGDIIKNGAQMASDSLFGVRGEDEKKKGEEFISGLFKDAKKYLPELSGGAVLGGGLSLLTGGILGPVAGAAIGASVNLVKNSDAAQDWLFGKTVDGERQGGIVKGDTVKKMKKYLPDLKNYGISGGVAGLMPFLPFGPVGGVMLGSAFAYAKNNDGIQKALFGAEGSNGLVPKEALKKLKKVAPKVAIGAAGGLMMGPFGLLGNMMLGSGVGYLTTSEKFQNMMLGTYNPNSKKYENGILPDFRDKFIDPLRNDMKGITDKIGTFIDKEVLAPLKSAMQPIMKQFQLMGKGVFKGMGKIVDTFTAGLFGVPISQIVRKKIIQPFADGATKVRRTVVGGAKKIISAPFKAVGAVGDHFRRKQIKNGDADYMTAEERLEWRKNNKMMGLRERGMFGLKKAAQNSKTLRGILPESMLEKLDNPLTASKDKTLSMDKFLANASSSELEEVKNSLSYLHGDRKTINKTRKKYSDTMVNDVTKFDNLSVSQQNKVLKHLKNGDTNSALKGLEVDRLSDKERKDLDLKNSSLQLKALGNKNSILDESNALIGKIFGKEEHEDLRQNLNNLISKGNIDEVQKVLYDKLPKKEADKLFNKIKLNNDTIGINQQNKKQITSDLYKKLDNYGMANDHKSKVISAMKRGDYDLAEAMISTHNNNNDNVNFGTDTSKYIEQLISTGKGIDDSRNKSKDILKTGLDYSEQVKSAMKYVESGDEEGLRKYLSKNVEEPEVRSQITKQLTKEMKALGKKKQVHSQYTNQVQDGVINNDQLDDKTRSKIFSHLKKGNYSAIGDMMGNGMDLDTKINTLESLFNSSKEYNKFDENSKEHSAVQDELQAMLRRKGISASPEEQESLYKYVENELKNKRADVKEDVKEDSKDNIIEVEKENHNEIVTLFSSAVDLLKELVDITKKPATADETVKKVTNNSLGDTKDGKFNPALKTKEGNVMKDVAGSLADVIANWFGSNLNQFSTGGLIQHTQMATISAGEAILSQDDTNGLIGLVNPMKQQVEESKSNHKQIVGLFASIINLVQQVVNPSSKMVKINPNAQNPVKSISETVNTNISKAVKATVIPLNGKAIGASDKSGEDMEVETDDGIIRYKTDSKGNKVKNLSDPETKETVKKSKEKKGLMASMMDRARNAKNSLFGKKKEDEGEEGKKKEGGFFSKLIGGIGKKIAMVAGIGLMAKVLMPMLKPLWDNVMKPFITETVIPGIATGLKELVPVILTGIKDMLPSIVSGLGEAFKFALTDVLPAILPVLAPVLAGVGGVKLAGSIGKSLITGGSVKDTIKNFGKKDMTKVKEKGIFNAIRHPLKTAGAAVNRGIGMTATGIGKLAGKFGKKGAAATAAAGTAGKKKGIIGKVAGKVAGKFGGKGKGGKAGAIASTVADVAGNVAGGAASMIPNVDISSMSGSEAAIIRQIQITGANIVNAINGTGGGLAGAIGADGDGGLLDTAISATDLIPEKTGEKAAAKAGKKGIFSKIKQKALGVGGKAKGGIKGLVKGLGRKGKGLLGLAGAVGGSIGASQMLGGAEEAGTTVANNALLSTASEAGEGVAKVGVEAGEGAMKTGAEAATSKGFMSKIASKVKGSTSLTKITTGATTAAQKMGENMSRNGLINQVLDFIKKLLNSAPVKAIIGSDAVKSILEKLIPKIAKELAANIAKASAKVMAKITSAITTGGLLNIAWAVADFTSGYNNAHNILGVTDEPSFGMKVVAGLVKAMSGLLIITALVPDKVWVDMFVDVILPILGETDTDLQKQRMKANNELAKYNSDNGTNLTLDEYNTDVKGFKSFGQKVKDFASNSWNKAKDIGSSIWKKGSEIAQGAVDGVKWVGNKVADGASWVGNKIADGASWVGNKVSNGVNWVKGKLGFGNGPTDSEARIGQGNGKGASTPPSSQQVKNGMVYYSQGDSRWAQTQYGTDTMKASACGPTSAAMVLSSLTGKTVLPTETAQYSVDNGFRVPGVGTDWGFFSSIGKKYGVDLKQTSDKNSILSALGKGQPVIFSGQGPVPYTKGGHFVVGAGLDSNGDILINDPVSLERSKAYKPSTIFGSMAASWISGQSLNGKKMPDNTPAGGVQTEEQAKQAESEPSLFNLFTDMGNAMQSGLAQMYNTRAGGFGNAMGNGSGYLISDALVDYIKTKEGFSSKLYYDSGGVPTIGYGSTHGPIMNKGSVTKEEATQALKDEAQSNAKDVKRTLDKDGVKLNQSQFDSMVDLTYNIGLGGFQGSTVRKKLKSNDFGSGLKDALLMWVKDEKGQKLPGLVTRRTEEYNIFKDGKAPGYNTPGNIQDLVTGGSESSGSADSSTSADQEQNQQSNSIFNIFDDLGNALKGGFDSMYGFKSGTTAASAADATNNALQGPNPDGSTLDTTQQPQQGGNGQGGSKSSGIPLNGAIKRTADEYFTRTLNAKVTSGIDPNRKLMGQKSPHFGIDYAAKKGTEIKSPIGGTVITNSVEKDGFGNYLVVKDNNGKNHYFGHMDRQSPLSVGQKVNQGAALGNVGSTGFSTGSHLHYEVRDNSGSKLNPNKYLDSYAKNDKKPVDLTIKNQGGMGGQIAETKGISDKVLELILKVLMKIADNTENLGKIVSILSENANDDTKKAIKKELKDNKAKGISKANMPVSKILSNSLQNNSDQGNMFILNALEALASE